MGRRIGHSPVLIAAAVVVTVAAVAFALQIHSDE
jgi:hypothetical protein